MSWNVYLVNQKSVRLLDRKFSRWKANKFVSKWNRRRRPYVAFALPDSLGIYSISRHRLSCVRTRDLT